MANSYSHPNHLADWRKSGLSDETILEAGIKSVPPRDIPKKLGFDIPGLISMYEIPYPDCEGYSRFKAFYADGEKQHKDGKEKPKYLARKDSGNHLHIPDKVRPILKDLSIPLYIAEGEKKSLKATQEGLPCIAISGLWNWKVKDKDELISDFNLIALDGRIVYLVPDSHWQEPDRHGNQKNLGQAVNGLAHQLINRGAKVFLVELPKGDIEVKLDDYLCIYTIEDFKKLSTKEMSKLSKDKREITQPEKLIKIATRHKLFHDDTKEGYAYIENVAVKIRGSMFKQLLARELWESENKSPNSDALNQALNVIEAMAVYDGECIKLSNRVAEHEGCFYYDLADGRAVRITKDGWDVIDNFPILFKRYSHQQKQAEPEKGGDIQRLFRFINVSEKRHRLLSLVYLISCFVPNIPHPIFHPWGDQGAGKTSLFTFCKLLIDPSKMSVIITPRNMEETIQVLEHHYLCMFDNLSSFPDWLSDLLSQACTGGGFSKRKLYSDDEDIIYQIQRCIGLNGINLLISRADLMDRTILLHLERIEPSKRKEWRVLMQEFEEERPYILGCFFDVLSKAMGLYPSIKLDNLPRMADFMRWGVAITKALGYEVDDFIQAYQGNIESQNAEIINSNTLAQAVLTFMRGRESWNGTVKQAYEELGKLGTVTKDDKTFPGHSNKLRRHLNRIKANLLDYGIKFTIADYDSEHKGCQMSFQQVPKVSSLSRSIPQTNNDKGFEGDDKSGISEYPESIPQVSRQPEPSKIKECGIHEDTEDKKQTSWSEEEIPEVEFVEVIANV